MATQGLAVSLGGPAYDFDAFAGIMSDIARVLRRANPSRPLLDTRVLDEVARARQITTLYRVVSMARQCADPLDACYLAEQIRSFILSGHPALDLPITEAFRAETRSNALADQSQLEFLIAPSSATRQQAIDGLLAQLTATRSALDALHVGRFVRTRPMLVK